ncbi:MAG: carbon monoxide dehydrogenase subunit G [Proteobacteria bacterium]|nr:carbon monoxide dehydrogenase subunit G [Pseudomonadota bacterium]
MKMSGEQLLSEQREAVWAALNDVEVLARCIPGCESLTRAEDDVLVAVATIKVGPVKARFRGRITLSDMVPPESYVISGQGQGGAAGFAKGSASVMLEETAEGTRLSYEVTASLGGRLAQLGARLIDATAKKLADEFFANFAAELSPAKPPEEEIAAGGGGGLSVALWISGLALLVLASLALFAWR